MQEGCRAAGQIDPPGTCDPVTHCRHQGFQFLELDGRTHGDRGRRSVVGCRLSVVGGRWSVVGGRWSVIRKTVKACSRFGQELFATRPGGPKTREARLSQVGGWRATAGSAVKEMRKGCPRSTETSELELFFRGSLACCPGGAAPTARSKGDESGVQGEPDCLHLGVSFAVHWRALLARARHRVARHRVKLYLQAKGPIVDSGGWGAICQE